jgi:flagellar protein FlaF
MSLKAYQKAQTSAETPRQTEYRLFAEVTKALLAAKEMTVKNGAYVEALDWNRRMWSTLTTDCAMEGNQLPKNLRASIISIGMWVSKYTSEVIRTGADIDALIDVNRAIMEGLAARLETAPAPSPASPNTGALPVQSA